MAEMTLHPGEVFRTRELRTKNPARYARQLVAEGKLRQLQRGLYAVPKPTRFGEAPPPSENLVTKFLGGSDFVFTGPDRWNALGLGTTAMFVEQLVYNRKRTGTFDLAGQRFRLRRVAFPRKPSPEWFVVDLFENAAAVGGSHETLTAALGNSLREGRFDREALSRAAKKYGTKRTRDAVARALTIAGQ
jgi:hypothetical protein